MAQYKVPQDVEADDKLIGPFSFRQFVYLLIAAGLIAAAVGLFQVFPLLAIIPVPFILLLLVLALPLKKDQPMETYLAAIVSYHLKPRQRIWTPGQRESTIFITAPKIVEEVRTRDLSQEEATHRLSFLADIVDTEGYAIKGAGSSSMREDLVAEANATSDMFDKYQSSNLEMAMNRSKEEMVRNMREGMSQNRNDEPRPPVESAKREELLRGMREAISRNSNRVAEATIKKDRGMARSEMAEQAGLIEGDSGTTRSQNNVTPQPGPISTVQAKLQEKQATNLPKPSIMELANNSDFSVATIEKEANRIKGKEKGEVFISLH